MWKGLSGATGNLYCGLMEYSDMGFLLHFLRSDDLFVDIGANIGVYTILASAEVKANTISIEPIPSTFKSLVDNININNLQDKVQVMNIGLGGNVGKLNFTKSLDCINHVALPNDLDTIEVSIYPLDAILPEAITPILIKIDVEGFETEVLKGAEKTLSNDDLKVIIIELNGSGKRYDFDDTTIHDKLLSYGFKPYSYNPKIKRLLALDTYTSHNTIYLRDIQFVENRIEFSRSIKIGQRYKI